MDVATTLVSTVGTSLFYPNLTQLDPDDPTDELADLAKAFRSQDWKQVAEGLREFDPDERICGAEINSIESLMQKKYIAADANLYFCHSDTDDGRAIGNVLREFYRQKGNPKVELLPIEGLNDIPKEFRSKGLRNLAKKICGVIREYGETHLAINATGGYKAQIAIGVLMGQSIGVPDYYKHERFSEIIAFPPMPVSLDFEVWLRSSGMLFALNRADSMPVEFEKFEEGWEERFESLIERVRIDGKDYIELSPTGQIFHETFRARFEKRSAEVLPPPALPEQKKEPSIEKSGHMRSTDIGPYLSRLTREVDQVTKCDTHYYNPDLSQPNRFRITAAGGEPEIEGIYSNGSWTIKYYVYTTASTEEEKNAMLARLNQWLDQ